MFNAEDLKLDLGTSELQTKQTENVFNDNNNCRVACATENFMLI